MISNIGYVITFFNLPLVIWLGMLTFSLVLLQVFIAVSNIKWKKRWIPFSVHRKLGYVIVCVAATHATLVGLYWF